MENKVMSPAEAVGRFVHDGDHISMGGFTVVRNPMGLALEIVRQKIRNLHLYAHSQGQALDLLIGAGCIDAVEIAYGGHLLLLSHAETFNEAVLDWLATEVEKSGRRPHAETA